MLTWEDIEAELFTPEQKEASMRRAQLYNSELRKPKGRHRNLKKALNRSIVIAVKKGDTNA